MKDNKNSNNNRDIEEAIVKELQLIRTIKNLKPAKRTENKKKRSCRLKHDYLCFWSSELCQMSFEQTMLTSRSHLLDPNSWWKLSAL